MKPPFRLPIWSYFALALFGVFLALLLIFLSRSQPAEEAQARSLPEAADPTSWTLFTAPQAAPTATQTAYSQPVLPTNISPTPIPIQPSATPFIQTHPLPSPTPTVTVQTGTGEQITFKPLDVGVMTDLEFKTLLGNSGESGALLSALQARGRQPDLVGFATWYYLPTGMNAYRTMYNENTCFVAVDSRTQDDTGIGMHFALVTVDAPTPSSPFMAYVGDIGPLGDIQMAFAENGNAVQVLSGGEPLVIDVPVGCFTTFVNNERRTSHVSVYLLSVSETLEYLETLPLGRP